MKISIKSKSILTAAILGSTLTTTAYADSCNVKGKGTFSIISNSQPAFIGFSKEAATCKNLDVDWKIMVDNKSATYEALSAPKSPVAGVILSNAQFGKYSAEGLFKPITKIVKKYRKKYPYLTDDMLIKVNGEVYGIAFVTNLQHLVFRKDIFAKHNLKIPTTYTELLKVLKKIKQKNGAEYPFAAAYKTGWNLATEFTNLYQSTGKDFLKKGTSKPNINNKDGRRVLKMMKKLYAYSSPNSLSLASGDVTGLFQDGSVGAMQMWASRVSKTQDPKLSKVIGKVGVASALKLSAKDPYAASSMFWDGFAIPKTTQNDPEVTFKLFMELLDKETINKLNDDAVWISPYYKSTYFAKGIIDTRKTGVRIMPSSPQYNLLHNAIGKHLPDFLNGSKSARATLKRIEKDYIKNVKQKGL